MLAPLRLRGCRVPNRVVVALVGGDGAVEGTVWGVHEREVLDAVQTGPGIVLTEMIAVSPEGRITPGTPGLYRDEHIGSWRRVTDRAHREGQALLMAQIGHAGPRGSTRPRREGVDRPLRQGGWPVLTVSVSREGMDGVAEAFARATRMALEAGFDLLLLNLAHGYLLSSFISPLTNGREDEYGGSLEGRMRFPLEVLTAVRAVWPDDRPLAVSLNATDWTRGGTQPGEAVAAARMLSSAGCDLVRVLAGQTSSRARPEYGRQFLVPHSDRVRNEAGISTMVGGNLSTRDEVDTVLAAGRADLCQVDPVG